MEQEKRFIFNLTRLSSNIHGVSIDVMAEILEYINNNSIAEAQFIEEEYFNSITENDELEGVMHAELFSISHFLSCIKEAINTNDSDLFGKLRVFHRMGREKFRDIKVKEEIQKLIEKRKQKIEEKMVYDTIQHVYELLDNFPENRCAKIFSDVITQSLSNR